MSDFLTGEDSAWLQPWIAGVLGQVSAPSPTGSRGRVREGGRRCHPVGGHPADTNYSTGVQRKKSLRCHYSHSQRCLLPSCRRRLQGADVGAAGAVLRIGYLDHGGSTVATGTRYVETSPGSKWFVTPTHSFPLRLVGRFWLVHRIDATVFVPNISILYGICALVYAAREYRFPALSALVLVY